MAVFETVRELHRIPRSSPPAAEATIDLANSAAIWLDLGSLR